MKAHDYVDKLIKECQNDNIEFGKRLKQSLVRLTKKYKDTDLEYLITEIIKGDIFAYIFVPEIPRRQAITNQTRIQCGLALQSQPPSVDDLPKETYASYILVKNNSTLYFVNKLEQNDKIKSFSLSSQDVNALVSILKISNDSQVIPLLSHKQIGFIIELTKYNPTVSTLSSTYPQEWLALTPSQANGIIQNPEDKNIIHLGERYGAADIDCLWVVGEEATNLLADNKDTKQKKSESIKETIKRRNRPLEHPEFLTYIQSHIGQYPTCKRYIQMMIDSKYVFPSEKDYELHLRGKNNICRVDNTHHLVKNVALIKNDTNAKNENKYLIYYRYKLKDQRDIQKNLSSESLPRYIQKAMKPS